jgi:hypothetical protein
MGRPSRATSIGISRSGEVTSEFPNPCDSEAWLVWSSIWRSTSYLVTKPSTRKTGRFDMHHELARSDDDAEHGDDGQPDEQLPHASSV